MTTIYEASDSYYDYSVIESTWEGKKSFIVRRKTKDQTIFFNLKIIKGGKVINAKFTQKARAIACVDNHLIKGAK